MRFYSARRIVEAVDELVPDVYREKTGKAVEELRRQKSAVMVGCAYEMPAIRPSMVEISIILGTSHSAAKLHLEYWRGLDWQARYAWIRFVEGRLSHETNPVDAALL